MIFNSIVSFIVGVLETIVSPLPNINPDVMMLITSSQTTFRSYLSNLNWFFPVNTAFLFFAAAFFIQATIFGFKLARWIASNLTAGILK